MDNQLKQKIIDLAGSDSVRFDEPMASHTTFHIGGPADCFVAPTTPDMVGAIAGLCSRFETPLYIVGCGSNILVSDSGLRGVVIRIGSKLAQISVEDDGSVFAQAGATNAKIARLAQKAGFSGFEFAAGIPGSIGGAAIMNAGAYDGQLKDVAVGVTCLTPEGDTIKLNADQAQWGYRRSMMGERGYIVLDVELQLYPGNPDEIQSYMDELASRRSEKQPLDMPSAGSTFKRPEGYYAGKLIQDAGLQGYRIGGAQVSEKHAGFIVNTGSASADDVLQLIEHVRARVLDVSGVELEPEVRLWGF